MIGYIITEKGLSVYLDGELKLISKEHPHFEEIQEILKKGDEESLRKIINVEKCLNEIIEDSDITIKNGLIYYKDKMLDNYLTKKMVEFYKNGYDIGYLIKFLNKLMKNPSYRVVNHLYKFLEVGGIPINDKGNILTYKKIRKDWTDIYTGTIDNSVGNIVSVPRNEVDEDPEQTCSYGLHVCSYEYLPNFGISRGDRVVICEVEPNDVVAIPKDYNFTKMRVCKYKVIDELKNVDENILSSKLIYENEKNEEEFFEEENDDYEINTITKKEKYLLLRKVIKTRLMLSKMDNELLPAFKKEMKEIVPSQQNIFDADLDEYECLLFQVNDIDELKKINNNLENYIYILDIYTNSEIEMIEKIIKKYRKKIKFVLELLISKISKKKKLKSILKTMRKNKMISSKQFKMFETEEQIDEKLKAIIFDPFNDFYVGYLIKKIM
jgi:hypothetical protein